MIKTFLVVLLTMLVGIACSGDKSSKVLELSCDEWRERVHVGDEFEVTGWEDPSWIVKNNDTGETLAVLDAREKRNEKQVNMLAYQLLGGAVVVSTLDVGLKGTVGYDVCRDGGKPMIALNVENIIPASTPPPTTNPGSQQRT